MPYIFISRSSFHSTSGPAINLDVGEILTIDGIRDKISAGMLYDVKATVYSTQDKDFRIISLPSLVLSKVEGYEDYQEEPSLLIHIKKLVELPIERLASMITDSRLKEFPILYSIIKYRVEGIIS